jgi:hypothetical protein
MHVTTRGGLAGVINIDSSATIRDSVIEGSGYGIVDQSNSGSATVQHSDISGTTAGIHNPGSTVRVASSKLVGGVLANPVTSAGVWNGSYAFFASTCP